MRLLLAWLDHQSGSCSERTHVTTNNKALPMLAVLFTAFFPPTEARAQTIPNGAAIDAEVNKLMTRTSAKGMAVAVIDHGKVR
jgi:CubicO group peptidase (beta-lactamase class C family)